MSAFAVEELCRPSPDMSCDGFWSGTEDRRHQPYIAMVPECRYIDQSEILKRIIEEVGFKEPKPYVPKRYPTPSSTVRIRKAAFIPTYRQTEKQKSWNPPPFNTVRISGIGIIPSHLSGWPNDQVAAWLRSSEGQSWRKRYPYDA